MRILEWDREHLAPDEIAWTHGDVTHRIVRTFGPSHIDETHRFTHRNADQITRELEIAMRRIYRWDFHAMREATKRAGFSELKSDVFTNDKGHSFAMNRAIR